MHQQSGSRHTRRAIQVTVAVLVLVLIATGDRAYAQLGGGDLTELSLEDLLNLEITSVSRRTERLSDAAAAVSVLTNDDIRRSGARTIPDVLRLVPGLHVGQIDSNTWSVSVRGFGSRFANKLLVLVDGRSVYTPLFSGVFWNLVYLPLEDVDRIEVVRGVGATMWGANAVNGVINIITRSAAVSHGGLLTVSTGSETHGLGSFRYGTAIGRRANARVDAGGLERSGSSGTFPSGASNDWRVGRVGFRVDWQPRDNDAVSVQGSLVGSRAHELWKVPSLTPPYRTATVDQSRYTSGNILGEWTRSTRTAATTLQMSDERSTTHELVIDERRHTINLDLQQARHVGARHELVFGGTYRRSADHTVGTSLARLVPDTRVLHLWSFFGQDDVSLLGGRMRLTPGSKFEHNDYTGWEIQPNLRAFVGISERQSLWGAVSRAVRLPSRAETEGVFEAAVLPPSAQSPLPQLLVQARDAGQLSAETLVAYEAGYRVRLARTLSIDVAVFENRYRGLLEGRVGTPAIVFAPVRHLVIPVLHVNGRAKSTVGGEFLADWRPVSRLRMTGGYSRFHELAGASSGQGTYLANADYPGHQVHGRAAVTLPKRVDVDLFVRYVSTMPESAVPAYITADARFGVRRGRLDASLVGQNLLAPRHTEYLPNFLLITPADVTRSINLRIAWRF